MANRSAEMADERCVVCHCLSPRHGGLCCDHRYDEQPACERCATKARFNPVSPSDGADAWDEWATFANNVSEALGELPERPLFSRRTAVARALWDMGYRPTAEQVEAAREASRQRHNPPSKSGDER